MSNFRNDNRSKIGGRCGKGWMEGPKRTDAMKCGKGWERGPGEKCVRSKKKRTIGQVIGGAASKVFPSKDIDKSYKWNEKKTKKMAAAAGIALAGGGALALAGHYRNQGSRQSQRTDAMKKPRCKKGKPCGAICIPKDSDCKEGDLYGHEIARYNQEFMAASLMGWTDKDGQPDTSKLKSMRPADRNMLLKAAQDYMTQNFKYDSAEVDTPAIKQEIEAAHGFRVDDIYRVQTRSDGALVGIGVSGGDFFEFDITNRSVGVVGRSDLTSSANERARGVLSASGIDYRGDSAFEYLRGREVRLDAPMQSNGQCGKGWKPGPGGKCVRSKGMGMAGKIGLGLAGAAALGGAAYAGRKQLSEAYLNVRSGAAGSQAKYEARKAATMAKRAAGKDARRAVKQGIAAAQGAANQAGREVRKATVMAKRAAGKTVRQAGNVLGRGISEGTAKKVDQAKYQARKAMVQAKRAAGKDARRSAKQGIAAAQGTVAKVDRTAFATAGRVAGKDARQRVTGNVRQAISRDVREINREVGRQKMAGRK